MSTNTARNAFDAALAEQRTGILRVTIGEDRLRIRIDPESVEVLDWHGRSGLKLTDILIFEGVAVEDEFALAIKESKQKKKPIEEVLVERGLLDAELTPAINERLVIEEILNLLDSADDAELIDDDGEEPGQFVASVESLLGFMSKIEDMSTRFRKVADRGDIVALNDRLESILGQHEVKVAARTVGKAIDGKTTVRQICEKTPLPQHHVISTLLAFKEAGVLKQLNLKDLRRQAAETEEAGKYDEAYELYQAAHELKKSDIEILEKLSQIAEIVEDKPGIASHNSLLALYAVSNRNEQLAAKCYERVARYDSHHREAHEFLFRQASHQEMAGEMLKIGRELMRIYIELKEYELAKQVATRCLKYAPDDMRILDALAKTYATCDEIDQSVEIYEKLIALHDRRGEKQESMNLLLMVRRLAPDREDIKRRIEAVHSAERRRQMIRFGVLAITPVILLAIGFVFYLKAQGAAATRAQQSVLAKVDARMGSADPEELKDLLTKVNNHLKDYPDDEMVLERGEALNIRIFEVEERISREVLVASEKSQALLDRAIDAEIGPPADFATARRLLDEAVAAAPTEDNDLRRRLADAISRVSEGLKKEDEARISKLVELFDRALDKNDIGDANGFLDQLKEYKDRYESAHLAIKDRVRILERATETIIDAAYRDATNLLLDGRLDEAEVAFMKLKSVTSDPKVLSLVNERLADIEAQKEESYSLLRDAEKAVERGELALALGLYRKLHTQHRNSSAAAMIRIPVQITANVARADVETPGEKMENVDLPITLTMGVEEVQEVTLSRKGFKPRTLTVTPSFDNYATMFELMRLPAWTFQLDGSMARRTLVAGDRLVVTSTKSSVHLISLDGKPLWNKPYSLGGITGFSATPVVAGDVLVMPLTSNEVIGISLSSGEKIWATPTPRKCRGSPVLGSDGSTVFLGCDDMSLIAMNSANGQILRTADVGSSVCGELFVHDGRIYFGVEDDSLRAVDERSLEEHWRHESGSDVVARPVFASGVIIYGSRDSHVYCLTTEGEEKWKTRVSGPVIGDLATWGDRIFATTAGVEGKLHMIALVDGREISVSSPLTPIPGGVTTHAGKAYLGAEDGRIYSFATSSGVEVWALKSGGRISTAPTVAGNLVIFGTSGNQVYAFDEGDQR